MKGIILAGGTGSRLLPLTKVTNKHLLPVGKKPMIFHPLGKLVEAGIREIMIVSGVEHMDSMIRLMGSGSEYGADLTYRIQDMAGGIAQALNLCKQWVGSSKMCVILGDNIFDASLVPFVKKFEGSLAHSAMVLLKKVPHPERFGVAEVDGDDIVSIEEKPKEPKSNLAVTGIYFYDERVFDVILGLRPSKRGELEITDVNNYYVNNGNMKWERLPGSWSDAGTFESLLKSNLIAYKAEGVKWTS